jgi:hypothetical protein
MWGLSLEDYRYRDATVEALCGKFSDSEKQIMSETPIKDRQALPFIAKFTACRVHTMRGDWDQFPTAEERDRHSWWSTIFGAKSK